MAFYSGGDQIYRLLADTVNAALSEVGQKIVQSVQGELGSIIYLLMILAVVLMGYRMVLGRFSSSQEFYSVVIRIAVAGVAVTAFAEYNNYVTMGVAAIKNFFGGFIPGTEGSQYDTLDNMIKATSDSLEAIRQNAVQGGGKLAAFASFFSVGYIVGFLLFLATLVMTAIACLFLLFSETLLTLFVGIGPLFFCFLLFEPTKQLFVSWFQAIVATLIFTLIVTFVVYLFVAVNSVLTSDLFTLREVEQCKMGSSLCRTVTVNLIDWKKFFASIAWCIISFFIFLVSLPITQQLSAGAGVPTGSIGRAVTAPLSLATSSLRSGLNKLRFNARYTRDTGNTDNQRNSSNRPGIRTNRGDYIQRTGAMEGISQIGKRTQSLVQRITGKSSKNANSAKNSNRKNDSPKYSDNNVAAPQTKAGVATVASSENTAANSAGNQNDQKSDSPKSSDNNVASPQTKAGVATVASSENTAAKPNNNRPNQSSHQLNSQNNARSSNNDLQPKTTVLNSPKDKQINRNVSETEQQQRSDDLASIQKSERGSNYSQTSERKNSEIDSQNSNKSQIDKVVTNQKSSDARLNKIENQISQSKSKTTQQTVDKSPIEVTKKQQESAIETTKNPRIPRKK